MSNLLNDDRVETSIYLYIYNIDDAGEPLLYQPNPDVPTENGLYKLNNYIFYDLTKIK